MPSLDRERWRAVSPYLDRALAMDPAVLASWLESLRAERPALAADLEALLADRDAAGRDGFLDDSDGLPVPRLAALGTLPPDAAGDESLDPDLGAVGPYRLIRRLGEGGMGIVYLAGQTEPIRREVALKVIRPGLDSAKVLARFAIERQILAGLSHAGIARVYEAGATDDGRPYVAMEYVPGEPLTRFCDERRLTVRERLELFVQVCAAIQHAHQKGIIHRDIKPSNILVSIADGRALARVIDFGIAKALQPTTGEMLLTQTGMTLGTPEYMSPEQASPDAGDVDTRSDVYALGVVLYELLVGARPFEARDLARPTPLALLEVVRDREPPKLTARLHDSREAPAEVALRRGTDLRRLLRSLGGELEWITLRALEKQPARRYASAAELAGDVERYLKGEPVLAGPPSTLYRLRKLARRHRVAATALAVVAVAITAGGVVSSLALLRAVRAEGVAREQLRDSLLNQALTLANSSELDGRERALAALERAAAIRPGLDARNAAIAALSVPGFHLLRHLQPSSGSIRSSQGALERSAWPDTRLRRYARGNADGSVSVHSIDDDAESLRLPAVSAALPEFGSFSPDGSWLAVKYQGGEVHAWSLSSRTHRLLLKGAVSCQFTPDSRHLIATTDGQVHLFDLVSGVEVRRPQARPEGTLPAVYPTPWPAVHPTEPRFLLPVYGRGRLEIRGTSDGEVERSLDMPPLGSRALWSADGRSLITTHPDFSIRVWDWPSAIAPRLILRFHRAEATYLATDPSGRWLATGGWGNQIAFFDLRDGRLLLNEPGGVVFAATNRPAFVLISGADWSLIELQPPHALDTVPVHESYKSPTHLAFSPNGRWLATAGPDGIRLLDLRSRDVRPILRGEHAVQASFSPDSTELRAISSDRLLAWRLEDDAQAGRPGATLVRAIPRPELPGHENPPSPERGIGEIAGDGERWMTVGRDPTTGRLAWILGRFGAADFGHADGFTPGSSGPDLSPDGAWAAWGNWQGRNATVMRLEAGDAPVELPVTGSAQVAFTPDSRLLALGGSREIRFHEVGTWRLLHSMPRNPSSGVPPAFAFTRDARLCAVSQVDIVTLLDTVSGREIGTLPARQHALIRTAFSPDDRILAVASTDHHVLLWDIEKLRRRLREIGLDWESGAGNSP